MNLFVYGTLLFPDIRKIVGGREFETREATLCDYQIFRVKGADFPGTVSSSGETVEGEVLLNLTREEFTRFDQYEDRFYSKKTVTVILKSNKEFTEAQTYVIKKSIAVDLLTQESWSKEWFLQNCHDEFVQRLKQRR